MKRTLLAAAALGLTLTTSAAGDEVTELSVPIQGMFLESANPEELGPIEVVLVDRSRDSCWTNLREVREYVEEKLIGEGFGIAPQDSESVKLVINIADFRQEASFGRGRCTGLINLELVTGLSPDLGLPSGNLVFASYTASIPSARTMNNEVIHFAGKFFEHLREVAE